MNKFRLAQLLAACVRIEDNELHYDYIGNVVVIERSLGGTRYKLASPIDGSAEWFAEADLKQVCHYIVEGADVKEGNSASVTTLDHPILGNEFVWTTSVLGINELGFFLTKNTLYIPNEVRIGTGAMYVVMQSPLLAQA